eukprot:15410844-Alexandrium_andersonii.AAC.1
MGLLPIRSQDGPGAAHPFPARLGCAKPGCAQSLLAQLLPGERSLYSLLQLPGMPSLADGGMAKESL